MESLPRIARIPGTGTVPRFPLEAQFSRVTYPIVGEWFPFTSKWIRLPAQRRECLRVRIYYRLASTSAEAAIFDGAKQMTAVQFTALSADRFFRCRSRFNCKPCA